MDLDWRRVLRIQMMLEKGVANKDRNVAQVIALVLDANHNEDLETLLLKESDAAVEGLTEYGLPVVVETASIAGVIQGVLLAKAVQTIREEDGELRPRFNEAERENAQRALTQSKPKLSTDEAAEIVDIVLLAASR